MPPGRKPGSWNEKPFKDALRRAVHVIDKETKRKKIELLAEQLLRNALAGDTAAIKEAADRLDGKAHQSNDITISDERMVVNAPQPEKDADEWAQKNRPH